MTSQNPHNSSQISYAQQSHYSLATGQSMGNILSSAGAEQTNSVKTSQQNHNPMHLAYQYASKPMPIAPNNTHGSLSTMQYAGLVPTTHGYALPNYTVGMYNSNSGNPQPQPTESRPRTTILSPKGTVGSEEWMRQRRENHKEVERRRREAINEGISELAKLVPDGEKNKGRVINRAILYINELKQREAANLEKWTLEKLMCEQTIQELNMQNESFSRYYQDEYKRLGPENQRLREEVERLSNEVKELKRKSENSYAGQITSQSNDTSEENPRKRNKLSDEVED